MKRDINKYAIIVRCALMFAFLGLTFSCYAKPNNNRANIAAQYIKKGTTPYDYIADKLRNYKVIAIGEDHWIADHSEFLCDILRNVGYTGDTHISNLALNLVAKEIR